MEYYPNGVRVDYHTAYDTLRLFETIEFASNLLANAHLLRIREHICYVTQGRLYIQYTE